MLTPSVAQEIARDTSAIIGLNVLITDKAGTVIGSGDTERLGSFHEASVEVMRTLRPASHGAEAANQLIGVLPGITLPILLDNEAVGTVGITGDPDQVQRFGLVVRNQTEILLRESLVLRSRLLRESAVEDLLRDIAHYDPAVTEPEFIAFKATELGYDLRLRRAAMVMDVTVPTTPPRPGSAGGPSGDTAQAATLQSALLRAVRRAFPHPQDLVGTTSSGRFVVLHHLAAPEALDLLTRCRTLTGSLAREHGVACRIGVGGVAATVAGLRDSYRDATSVLYLTGRLGRREPVAHIDEVRIHDLLAGVGHSARTRFAHALVEPLRQQPDWPVTRETITAWCESGFHLVRASAALRIHRNTLVYRLDKIEGMIGPGFREPRTCLAIYLACLIDCLESQG
jgi:carbohydrate diacid regulator